MFISGIVFVQAMNILNCWVKCGKLITISYVLLKDQVSISCDNLELGTGGHSYRSNENEFGLRSYAVKLVYLLKE
jgi:hypothetical protein